MAWLALGSMAAAGLVTSLAAWKLWKRFTRGEDITGQVALITGASRGLGLAMAREFVAAGARVVICARSRDELDWARQDLARRAARVPHPSRSRFWSERVGGAPHVLAIQCDVSHHDDVQRMVREALAAFGRIDILVNNAGIITVGPLQAQTLTDYQECLDTMFWGVVYPTLAVLPHMLQRRSGRIANITSIGGKVSVPHLLPYTCAKFAAVGFSEGLHAEVKKFGVTVTTVVPGLMRTGSFVNAYFKGRHRAEYRWFSLSSALPVLAMNGRRAARTIVNAIRRRDAEITLTPQAKLLAVLNGLFPGAMAEALALANRLLPSFDGSAQDRRAGKDSESLVSKSALTTLGRRAAEEFHQYPERRIA